MYVNNRHFMGHPDRQRPLNERIGNWIVGLTIVGFFCLALAGRIINTDPDHTKQLAIYASLGYRSFEELKTEVDTLGASLPQRTSEPAEYYKWLARVHVAKQATNDFKYWFNSPELFTALNKRLEGIEKAGNDSAKITGHYAVTFILEAKQVYTQAIETSRVPLEQLPLLPRLAWAYALSAILMGILMAIKAKNQKRSLLIEIATPSRLPLAMIAWPITAMAYPYGTPLESLRYALNFAAWILSSFLSLGMAGIAKAQSSSSGNKVSKQSSGWVFQADTRYGLITSGIGPDPQRQQRLTIISPNGWEIENIAGSNDRVWNNLFTAGKRIFKNRRLTINILPGMRITHSKSTDKNDTSVSLNGQVFSTIPLPKHLLLADAVISANPVIQWERGINGSAASKHSNFTWVNQTFLKLRRFNLFAGWEGSLSKTAGKPPAWTSGPLLEWQIPKKRWPRLGIGYIKNQLGASVLRFRLTETISP